MSFRLTRSGLLRLRQFALACGAAAAVVGGGCASEGESTPLRADAFTTRSRPTRDLGNPVDQPGPLLYDNVHVPLVGGQESEAEPVRKVSPVVQQSVQGPDAGAARPSPTPGLSGPPMARLPPASEIAPPLTRPVGDAGEGGKWVNLGAVLMEVNGQPIFTDRVLDALEAPLSAEAKTRTPPDFRNLASELIKAQLRVFQRDELEYASAKTALDAQDEALAQALTMQWRQKKITEAGGSVEQAKRRAADQGLEFDEMVKQRYRTTLVQIFYQKRVYPRIQVAASDIRAYYNAHKGTEFTEHGSAKFRVIKIDPKQYAGLRPEALTKAEAIRMRAAKEDFAPLAREVNDDPFLRSTGGYVVPDGWVDEGAYAVSDIDKAVFRMQPGQVSDVIQANGAFYIVKLEALKPGGVKPFEDLAVQEQIRTRLQGEQLEALREQHVRDLDSKAITRLNPKMMDEALVIVMRRYPQWAAKDR